jgi:hypothetical protein
VRLFGTQEKQHPLQCFFRVQTTLQVGRRERSQDPCSEVSPQPASQPRTVSPLSQFLLPSTTSLSTTGADAHSTHTSPPTLPFLGSRNAELFLTPGQSKISCTSHHQDRISTHDRALVLMDGLLPPCALPRPPAPRATSSDMHRETLHGRESELGIRKGCQQQLRQAQECPGRLLGSGRHIHHPPWTPPI